MQRDMVLHAGPPIDWERLSATVRAAAVGALMHEGLAPDAESAERMASRGEVRFEPCHQHQAVGPMAGMTTYSMPVLIVENRAAGNRAYAWLALGVFIAACFAVASLRRGRTGAGAAARADEDERPEGDGEALHRARRIRGTDGPRRAATMVG